MMEGFGIHTFQMVNAIGKVTFVKFHWKPKLGLQSTLWDEAVKLQAPITIFIAAIFGMRSIAATFRNGSLAFKRSIRSSPTIALRRAGFDQAHS